MPVPALIAACIFVQCLAVQHHWIRVLLQSSLITADEENAIQYVKGAKEFYSQAFMYLIFVAVLGGAFGFKHPFILWGSIGWGIGLVVHGLSVFEVIGPNWERKQIEKRLGRPL